MNQFSWSLIEVNVLIIILFLGYLSVRNRFSFKQQRAVLIGLPFMAIAAISLKSIIDFSAVSYAIPIVELQPITIGQTNPVSQINDPWLNLAFMYGLGAAIIGLLFVFRLTRLLLFFKQNKSSKVGIYHIYEVKGKSSFSFFNRIQITPDLSTQEQEIVLEHEKMHVDKKHSIDNMVIELLHVVFWFNPIFFFIKREMVNLHEYQVDALMYKKHKVHYLKFLVNYALGLKSSHYLLTSRFYNQLTLKKRIKIMKTNIRKKSWLLGIIPLIGMAAILFQCTKENAEDENSREPDPHEVALEEKIYDIVDVEPEYNGGNTAMTSFIIENVEYPKKAKDAGVEGDVYVQFVVGSNGALKNVTVLGSSRNELLDTEAKRVVELMPNWIPGEHEGKKVAVKFVLPISFQLN